MVIVARGWDIEEWVCSGETGNEKRGTEKRCLWILVEKE